MKDLLDISGANDDGVRMKKALDAGAYGLDTRMRVIGKCAVGLQARAMVALLDGADSEERTHLRKFAQQKITNSGRPEAEKGAVLHALRAHSARELAHALLEECGAPAAAP